MRIYGSIRVEIASGLGKTAKESSCPPKTSANPDEHGEADGKVRKTVGACEIYSGPSHFVPDANRGGHQR
jgi:hypothetical protein